MVVPLSGNAGAGRKTHNPSGYIGKFHSLQEPHGGLGKKRTMRLDEQLQPEMQHWSPINHIVWYRYLGVESPQPNS